MTTPAQILLVEDNRFDAELALAAFHNTSLGRVVHVAPTGEDALHYLFGLYKYCDRQTHPLPNLVLLDLNMPGINGIEVLRQAKSTLGIKQIPILILTSVNEERDRTLAYDCGADGYFIKPISVEGQRALVQQVYGYWLKFIGESPTQDLIKS
ncbi:MAG: response regulator [Chloroflexi bacterium]|nr:response regulator [Chloroflexota bacterium]